MSLKICVYAICKNEMKFIDRWLSSLAPEADYIVVLDTGSTDGTYEYLQKDSRVHKVEQKIIDPWRFDTARNESMKLIPEDADICVVSDIDQTFRAGWGDELRNQFARGMKEVYGDIIDYTDDNQEIKRFLSKNVHPNSPEWWWERPIHEGLHYHGEEEIETVVSSDFVIEHHPDYTKSRGSYLQLLEREYQENSKDPLCAIYYGCELSFHGKDEESYAVFLKMNEECDYSTCPEIGYQVQLNLLDECLRRGELEKAEFYGQKAEEFGIRTRYLYARQADVYMQMGKLKKAKVRLLRAFNIKDGNVGWIEQSWYYEGCIERTLSEVYEDLKEYHYALAFASLAQRFYPDDSALAEAVSRLRRKVSNGK